MYTNKLSCLIWSEVKVNQYPKRGEKKKYVLLGFIYTLLIKIKFLKKQVMKPTQAVTIRFGGQYLAKQWSLGGLLL